MGIEPNALRRQPTEFSTGVPLHWDHLGPKKRPAFQLLRGAFPRRDEHRCSMSLSRLHDGASAQRSARISDERSAVAAQVSTSV